MVTYNFIGFNGMLRDDDARDKNATYTAEEGRGNSYSTEFRGYDPRIGRWLSPDPLASEFPWSSSYVGLENNPVLIVDPDGKAGQIVTVPVGAAIGAGLEYASQVIDNFSKNTKEKNFYDKAWNAMVKNIDGTDVLISTTAGAISGATMGLSLCASVTLNVGLSVGEDLAKSKLGTKTSEYGLLDAAISGGSSFVGDVVGNRIKKSMQLSSEAKTLYKKADKIKEIAERRNRKAQDLKAKKAQKTAESYGALKAFVWGETTEKVVSTGANKIKELFFKPKKK